MKAQSYQMLVLVIFLTLFVSQVGDSSAKTIRVEGKDSAAIAAAIAQSTTGDVVFFPEGVYACDELIRPKSATQIKGASSETTVLFFKGKTPTVVLSIDGCEDVEVCNLILDGAGNPYATQGILASNSKRLNLHNLTIRNLVKGSGFGPHGILFTGTSVVTDSEIADCRIENIAPDASFGGGIRMSGGSSRNRILRNTIVNTGRGGVFADNGSTDNVIRSNTVSQSHGEGLAIEVWGGCHRSIIEDNRIDHWLSVSDCDYCSVRRNIIKDTSDEYKFIGIEAIGSYCVFTDNLVGEGQKLGLSVSGQLPKKYVFWGRNVVQDCNQWGAQIQGDAGGALYQYFYKCVFREMPLGKGPVWYPGDEGHGFRINGDTRWFTFEECEFSGNGRCGLQVCGANVDALRFLRCSIVGNKAEAARGLSESMTVEWTDCDIRGNGSDKLPTSKPFDHPAPVAAFESQGARKVGKPVEFISASKATGSEISAVLWDFNDGLPSSEPKPSHIYTRPGKYRVTLIVWDATGRASRAEEEIDIAE